MKVVLIENPRFIGPLLRKIYGIKKKSNNKHSFNCDYSQNKHIKGMHNAQIMRAFTFFIKNSYIF